ncbi:MAG: hypothetical protein M3M88_01355, partial [Thermoproteota archaeon]|nr:hypothetical protein [Thermoproteota archaeon]
FIAMLYLAMKGKIGISYDKPRKSQINEHDIEGSVPIDGTNFRRIEDMEFIKITVMNSSIY